MSRSPWDCIEELDGCWKAPGIEQQLLTQLCEAMDKLLISVVHLQIQVDELKEQIKEML